MTATAATNQIATPARPEGSRRRPGALTRLGFILGLAPAAIVVIATIIYPLAHSLWLTFQSWNLVTNEMHSAGFSNWTGLLTDPQLRQAMWVTLVYTGGGVLLQTVLGLGLALALRQAIRIHLPGTNMYRVLVLAPLVIAPLIWAFYFRSFFSPSFGLFNQLLGLVGIPGLLWANSPGSALASLIFADTWQWTPFIATLMLAALLAIPSEVAEAAELDGANWFRSLIYVELPIIRNLVVVIVLLRMIDSVKYIELMYTITQGGPGTSTQTLNYYAFQTGFVQFQMGHSAVLAYVVFIVIMVATLGLIRFTRRSAT
jgi:multiple sugar transport system permease protein